MEDDEGAVNFRNLSVHRANNDEEALNLVRVPAGASSSDEVIGD